MMAYIPSDDWVEEERRHGDVRTYWRGCRCRRCTEANTQHGWEHTASSLERTAEDIAVLHARARVLAEANRPT